MIIMRNGLEASNNLRSWCLEFVFSGLKTTCLSIYLHCGPESLTDFLHINYKYLFIVNRLGEFVGQISTPIFVSPLNISVFGAPMKTPLKKYPLKFLQYGRTNF